MDEYNPRGLFFSGPGDEKMMNLLTKTIPLAALCLFLMGQPSFGDLVDRVVASVNDSVITQSDIQRRIAALARFYSTQENRRSPRSADDLARESLEQLIDERLLIQRYDRAYTKNAAKRYAQRRVDTHIEELKESMGEDQLMARLSDENQSLEEFREALVQEQVHQFLVRQSRESWIDEYLLQPVSQNRVEEYIEENPEVKDQSGGLEIQLILIRVPAEADLAKEQILRARGERILIKARAGENFDTLVEAHSDHEQSKPDRGVMKLASRDSPFPEFGRVFDLEAGKVFPELIHMPAGFAIVKVRNKQSLFNVARRAMALEQVEEGIEKLRAEATILYDEELFSRPFEN